MGSDPELLGVPSGTLETPPAASLDGLALVAARVCSAPIALISLLGSGGEVYGAACGLSTEELPRDLALSSHVPNGAPLIIPDAAADPRFGSHPLVAGHPYARFLAFVPLRTAAGRLLGVLAVLDRVPRSLTAEQLEGLSCLARELPLLLDLHHVIGALRTESAARQRAQQALAARDAEFRLLADVLPHIIWVCSREGTLEFINRQGLEFFGRESHELVELCETGALVHPDDRGQLTAAMRETLRTGRGFSLEARLRRRDGVFRWHITRVEPMVDAQGQVAKLIGTCTDAHEAREANDRSAFLLALSTELARISNPQELVSTAMLRLRDRLGVSRVTLAEFEEGNSDVVVLRQSTGDASRVEIASLPLEPLEKIAAELKQGSTTVVRDTRLDSRSAPLFEQWYAPNGVGAIISAPLLRGGSLVALLSAVDAQPRDWTDSEIELVKRVADIVWPALEKARADRALALSEERLRLAHVVAQLGTWEWDPETRAAYLSPEGCELFGCPRDAPPYEYWLAHIDPHDRPAVMRSASECISRGSVEIEYRYRHPTRGLRWIYSKSGMVDYAGQRCMVGISLDVTERRQAEEALKEVNRRKDEFLAMLAHELRNPLAPIRNAAQILHLHATDRPELQWARSVIDRQTRHLVRLVDDLLDVSRMVRGQIVLQKSTIDLNEIVRHAVETSRPLIRARKHRLSVKMPSQTVRIEGDLTRLAQVLANLLNNAAKYTDEGGQIWLEGEVIGQSVELRVRDTGPGIAPSLLPRVFDLFTQAERTLDRAQGGLGIGLTLVKRLVEMHGGTVEARSPGLGKGAEFIVRLPISDSGADQARSRAEQETGTTSAQGLKVLVVDDNVDAAESMAMLLSMEGYNTQTVHSAQAALDAASRFKPDVVLLDIGLPEMDGYEVARRLRKENVISRMRLVAITGYGQPADRERTEAAGFDRHLVKPVEPDDLHELLRSLAETRTSCN